MNFQQTLANQVRWTTRNFAHNLEWIPAEKWDWKPAPTALSAQEICGHIVSLLPRSIHLVQGEDWEAASARIPQIAPFDSASQAGNSLIESAQQFARVVENVPDEALERPIVTPLATLSSRDYISIVALDLMHHHGQIAYIQTLLGDTESHFVGD